MESKIVNVRMSDKEIKLLDRLAGKASYYDRSRIVRCAVEFLGEMEKKGHFYRIMAGYNASWKNYNFELSDGQI